MTKTYGVYVVRVWLEPFESGGGAWRASATDTVSKEKHYFAQPAELSNFLLALNLPVEPLRPLEPEDKGFTRQRQS